MAKNKKNKTRNLTPDHELLTSIVSFSDKAVLMIEFDASTNEIFVRRDDKTGASLSGSMTLE